MNSLISFVLILLCTRTVYCQNNGGNLFFPSTSTTHASCNNSCEKCCENYYLNPDPKNTNVSDLENDCCLPCPQDAFCNSGTTIETLHLEEGFWRASNNTTTFYSCYSLTCGNKHSSSKDCADYHTGLLCEVCVNETQYFDRDYRHCIDCPSITVVITKVAVIVHVFIGVVVTIIAAK